MLYDPKWEKQAETKAKPFSMAHVIAWLETMPPEETYNYTCNGHCLIAQYLEFLGYEKISVTSGGDYRTSRGRGQAPHWLWASSVAGGHASGWTFGAALSRVRSWAAR